MKFFNLSNGKTISPPFDWLLLCPIFIKKYFRSTAKQGFFNEQRLFVNRLRMGCVEQKNLVKIYGCIISSILIGFFMIGLTISVQAQIILRPTSINNPFFKFDQLFKVQLVNTTTTDFQGIVQVRVENNFSKSIFQINSLPLSIKRGQSLNANQINWENGLELANQLITRSLSQSGQLPNGQYVYCYRFIENSSGRTLGSHCQESAALNYQLPALIFPRHQQKVPNRFPVLSWQPPLPLLGNELNYSLKLVELLEGQSPVEAVYSNLPLLEKFRIKRMALPYPSTAIPLKIGPTYAWQVTAYWNELKIGDTEIWTFSLDKPKPIEQTNNHESYRLVKRELGSSFYVFSSEIYFAFQNQGYESQLDYLIYSKGNPKERVGNLPSIALIPGLNQLNIPIDKKLKLKSNHSYILEINDKYGVKHFLSFKYVQSTKQVKKKR